MVIARLRLRLSAGDVHDVAQNTIPRLFSELRRGKRYPVPFRVVVHRVLGNTIRGRWQDAKSRPECPFPRGWDITDQRPEHSVEGDEWVQHMIDRLPERDRQVATRRYLDRMEIQQIADDLLGEPRPFTSGSWHREVNRVRLQTSTSPRSRQIGSSGTWLPTSASRPLRWRGASTTLGTESDPSPWLELQPVVHPDGA